MLRKKLVPLLAATVVLSFLFLPTLAQEGSRMVPLSSAKLGSMPDGFVLARTGKGAPATTPAA